MRALDQRLILDLLTIEKRPDAWSGVLDTAIGDIEQLVLVGDLALASQLLEAIAKVAKDEASPFQAPAKAGMTKLVEGPMVRHLAIFLKQATDTEFGVAKQMCKTIGPVLVKPMSDAIMGEDNPRTVRRLRDILISFGPAAREYANELRNSRNPTVRRAAVDLLRALGGDAALPDLRAMLDDSDAAVQREALRAMVQVGTTEAYQMLERALQSGAPHTRDAIMQALGAFRDEKAAPLFVHILNNTPYTGKLEGTYTTDRRIARPRRHRRAVGRHAEGDSVSRRVVGARTHRAHPRRRRPARCAAWRTRAPIACSRRPRRRGPAACARSPRRRSPSRRRCGRRRGGTRSVGRARAAAQRRRFHEAVRRRRCAARSSTRRRIRSCSARSTPSTNR